MRYNNKKSPSPVKTIVFMMAATVFSKVLGLLRTTFLASHYGTTEQAEAFAAALKIPLTFFDFLFSAAILGCFIPVYNGFIKSRDTVNLGLEEEVKEADRFACVFFNVMLLVAGGASILGIIFAEPIINLITPNMSAETSALAVSLLRIMFPMIAAAAGTYTLVGVLQSKNSFLLPALLSSISNAGVIIYFAVIDTRIGDKGIYGLAAAYLLSWLVQLLTLAIPLARSGFKMKLLIDFKDPALRKALKSAPPIIIGSWLIPAASLLGTAFADNISIPGAIPIFDYAHNIYIMIAGILTYSICNFLFPKLSRLSAAGDDGEFFSSVREGISGSLMVVIPVMFAVLVLCGEGITVLCRRGEFTAHDAELTANLLSAIALGMPAFSIIELGSRVFYARGMLRPPVIAALSGVLVNLGVTAFLIISGSAVNIGISALGIGNVLGQMAAAVILIAFAAVKIKGLIDKNLVFSIIKISACSLLSYIIMSFIHKIIGKVPYDLPPGVNIVTAVIVFIPGAAVYLGAVFLLKKLPKHGEEKI